jgi:hypothetical protein
MQTVFAAHEAGVGFRNSSKLKNGDPSPRDALKHLAPSNKHFNLNDPFIHAHEDKEDR